MSIIHRTTLTPAKLELLAAWMSSQPWYRSTGSPPDLTKAGGFRLDDPEGEVGMEFMVVTDVAAAAGPGTAAEAYLVPMTYRGRPRDGGEDDLIGTTEHGVLGQRWVYDGTRDPVLVSELVALIQGTAQAHAQSIDATLDPTVLRRPVRPASVTVTGFEAQPGDASGTELRVHADGAAFALRFHRLLTLAPDDTVPAGGVSATWKQPDGTTARGLFVTARPVS